jgi:hypothetical protein
MAFLKDNKRKTTTPSPFTDSNVISLSLSDRSITDGHGTANFERLLYKGCPVLPMEGRLISIPRGQPEIVDADRKELVVRICNAVHSLDVTNRTKINMFYETVRYIRMLESEGVKDFLCVDSVSLYINSLVKSYHDGIKGKTLSSRQNAIKSLICELDSKLFKQCKELFFSFPSDAESVQPYTDNELKGIVSALQVIFDDYAAHLEAGTKPNIFPLYAVKHLNGDCKYSNNVSRKRTVSYRNSDDVWKSDLVRVAYYITCFYTGVNSSPLLSLKLSDIEDEPFKGISRGIYNLRTRKGRQSGRVNEIDVGFTKKARCFFERWIELSKKINGDSDGFLFPNTYKNKLSKMTSSSVAALNKFFIDLGLPVMSNQRFRKTKASLIMRATESIVFVSQGLNNSIGSASKHYADGNPVTIEFSLASALYIREQTALGKPLDKAISDSAFFYKDPLKESEVGKNFKRLSNGLRCGGAFKEKSIKVKDALVKEGLASNNDIIACHKFLECFGCRHHAVIAEIDDIWLLLSFSDVIFESVTRPSINSKPSHLLSKVNNTVQVIIERMKQEHTAVYKEAYSKYLDGAHPLWQDVGDVELILGVY